MFGLDFLFSAALFALPLAALPLILHLLYRRKSPVVQFPTLRFIKASMEQSAGRRKVRRWLLLALRMLLLALLIWAAAQPARALATRFFSGGQSAAVIVVDTSWSMQYRENQTSLLSEADQIVQSLLRNELQNASVLLMTSDTANVQRPFKPAGELLAAWSPLQPQTGQQPLSDQVIQARQLLAQQPDGQKLLLVISDFQSRDFARPLPSLADDKLRVIALDLHPEKPRSAGIAAINIQPPQPMPGLRAWAEIEVAGPANESRAVGFEISSLDGATLLKREPVMVNFDGFGQATARFDFSMPPDRWQLLTASLTGQDPMPWDDRRTLAVEMPDRQLVRVQDLSSSSEQAGKIVPLALDPSQGRLGDWPLTLLAGNSAKRPDVNVAIIDQVPDSATVTTWRKFVEAGGTLILMLKPGIESVWADAPATRALEQLLPSKPYKASLDAPLKFLPTSSARSEPSVGLLAEDGKLWEGMRADRIVPMTVADAQTTRMLIATSSADRRPAPDRDGLLYVRQVGPGRVFIWAAAPDSLSNNLTAHPLFLPLLVNQALRPLNVLHATNTTTGQPLNFNASPAQGATELRTPAGEVFQIKGPYLKTDVPGVYQWALSGGKEVKGIAAVAPPGDESQAVYRRAQEIIPSGETVLIARSLPEMQARISQVTQPQPKWSLSLALAIVFLCAEALVSTRNSNMA